MDSFYSFFTTNKLKREASHDALVCKPSNNQYGGGSVNTLTHSYLYIQHNTRNQISHLTELPDIFQHSCLCGRVHTVKAKCGSYWAKYLQFVAFVASSEIWFFVSGNCWTFFGSSGHRHSWKAQMNIEMQNECEPCSYRAGAASGCL